MKNIPENGVLAQSDKNKKIGGNMARKKKNFFKKKFRPYAEKASNALWSNHTSFCFLDRVDYLYQCFERRKNIPKSCWINNSIITVRFHLNVEIS